MALPPLLVKIGADTKGLDKGLDKSGANLAKFAKVGAASAAAVGAAMIALTKASLDNIDVLTKQARSLGLTTSAFQKMSLVAGEAGVETGKLSSMLGLMQRNIVELQNGTAKQAEVFGQLGLSIRDLQGLDPDEQFEKIAASLESITDPAEKTAAAMDVFGRSGRDAINMLDGYSAKIANAEAFQRRFGISVSQDVSQNVERANDAVGRLGQVFVGLGNQMAGGAAPAIEKTANALIEFMGAVFGAKVQLEDFFQTAENAEALLGSEVYNALKGNAAAIVENADNLQELARIYGIMRGPLMSATDNMSAFADQLRNSGANEASEEMMGLVDEAEELDRQFKNNEISAGEFDTAMNGVIDRAETLVTSLRSVSEVGYQAAILNLGDLRTALQLAASDAAKLRAEMFAGAGQDTGTGLTTDDGNLLPPSRMAPTTSLRPQLPGVDFGDAPSGGRGGGGRGLQDAFAQRLEIIMEGLQTERETVQAWYDEGLQVLQTARERELLTEAEYMDQRERLEKEHQNRLDAIRELGNKWGFQAAVAGGEQILSAVGQTNKKALKAAKVFGAGMALIDTMQGAARELRKGTFGFATAAAVIAKGIGFISAIKGVSDSGGGSTARAPSGGGSAAAATAQAPQQQVQTLNFSVQNDPFGISERVVRQIVGSLNQAQRDGSTLIRATVA
jgi:hypothetical protein